MYARQNFPPLGQPVVTLAGNQSYSIRINDVKVKARDQVLIETNVMISFGAPSATVSADLLRDGFSIINGPQTLTSHPSTTAAFSGITYSLAINFLDEPGSGCRNPEYTLVIINNAGSTPIQIQSYAATAKVKRRADVTALQSYPAAGTTASTIAAGGSQTYNLPAPQTGREVKLNANFNLITNHYANLSIEVLRADGTSVTNGPQTLISVTGNSSTFEENTNFVVVDPTPSSEYTFRLTNGSVDAVDVDFYTFTAEAYESEVYQAFPVTGLSALTIPSNGHVALPVRVKSSCPVQIMMVASAIFTLPIGANLLFNIRKGDKSLTNGPQFLFQFPALPVTDTIEINVTALAADERPDRGTNEYTVDVINVGTNAVAFDYLTVLAQ